MSDIIPIDFSLMKENETYKFVFNYINWLDAKKYNIQVGSPYFATYTGETRKRRVERPFTSHDTIMVTLSEYKIIIELDCDNKIEYWVECSNVICYTI